MSKQKKQLSRKTLLFIYLYVLLILLILTTAASYTWFSLSRTPRVSDMFLFINSDSGLEISADPSGDEWVLQLDFRDLVDVTAPLRPITWSERDQRFYAASYGLDGRLHGIEDWHPLADDEHANKDDHNGYYIKTTFYARSSQTETVSLSPAVEVDDGIAGSGTYVIGTPLWDGQELLHQNGGQGAECAMRVGFRITPVNTAAEAIAEPSDFIIYEPNSDLHIDGTQGYVPTPGIHGSDTLVPEERLILQSASTWTEAYPVERDVVIKDLGEFQSDPRLFSLEPGDMVKIELYVWLEGQDVDCTNQIDQAQIIACIQMDSEAGGQSGLKPIE